VIESFVAGLLATSPLEAVSVVLGLLYAILAVKRVRWCWVAGGVSSAILAWLAFVAKLPMQAALQAYYVAMAVYGFWHWSREGGATRMVSTMPLKYHLAAWVVIVLVSILTARWLAAETEAAWPLLDSAVTWTSLLATLLTARVKLENWLYWFAADAVAIYLFVAQGLMFVAVLFFAFMIISMVGFVTWRKALLAGSPAN
jgi:nicotinamide mononucleotide transporter